MVENTPPDDDQEIPGIDRPFDEDEVVGYRRPPKQYRFKKGQSGNPKGRPRKQRPARLRIVELLEEPMTVNLKGRTEKLQAFEIGARRMVQKAVQERDTRSAIEFLKLCTSFRLFEKPPQKDYPSVVRVPKRWDVEQWNKNFDKYGAPPWPGPDDGLTDEDREYQNRVEPVPLEDPRWSKVPRAQLPRRNLLLRILLETHMIKEADAVVRRTTLELVIRVLKAKAISPDLRALRQLEALLRDYGNPPPPTPHPVVILPEPLSEEEWMEKYGNAEDHHRRLKEEWEAQQKEQG